MIKKFLKKIFKKVSYFIFIKIHGKIEKSIHFELDSRIEVKKLNLEKNLNYKIYKIQKGRLYTDRIHDTAVMIDKKIVEGPSFQLRENNNSSVMNNSVLKNGTPRMLKNIKGVTVSLLTGGGGNDNYWHWLYDVLPRIKLCEEFNKISEIDYFLLPSIKRKFQKETLNLLNVDKKKLLSSEDFRHIKASELIVTDHPYILTNDSHIDAQKIPGWISKWLKEKFLLNSKPLKKDYPKRIYIDRGDAKTNFSNFRSLTNETEVKNFLKKKNFNFIKLDNLNFEDQVHYFNNADFIIGLHGAGFANLSFCREGTKVIEFRMSKTGKVIENLAEKNSLIFDSIECKPKLEGIARHVGHIEIPLDILDQKINNI
ncbi:glycosyltransferase family 61 protein [Pelagibacteraceae bacterium]|nr:glycosyltransferase family 61 protein [Pelagibacteraceae bacterium]